MWRAARPRPRRADAAAGPRAGRRALTSVAGTLAVLLLPAAPAIAAPACETQPAARTLVSGLGRLESVIADPAGRLYFTDITAGALFVLSRPGAEPRVLVDGIDSPGGLAFAEDGSLLVGFGNSIPGGTVGNVAPQAGLLRVDTRTGESEVFVEGLSMANGVAAGPDGALYASDDFGLGIDRVVDGQVERNWASVVSPNGLVVDREGRYLYAAQTFQPAAIQRVEIAKPDNVSTYVSADPADIAAGPDGMTRDGIDRLYVAANGGGEIWRVNRRREICSLASYAPFPDGPSAVAFGATGRKGPFPRTSLYFVTFAGELVELPGVLSWRAAVRARPG